MVSCRTRGRSEVNTEMVVADHKSLAAPSRAQAGRRSIDTRRPEADSRRASSHEGPPRILARTHVGRTIGLVQRIVALNTRAIDNVRPRQTYHQLHER